MGVSFKRVSVSFFLMLLSVAVLVAWAYPTSALADQEHGLVAGSALLETQADDISAVAVFDPSDGSLTFYNRASADVPVPDGATVYNVPLDGSTATWSNINFRVKSVSFVDRIAPISTSRWFADMSYCTSMDLAGLDTSNVADMSWMFYRCYSISSLDLSSFDTSSAGDMSDMFDRCTSLTSLDLSGWDTSNVTNMSSMFLFCESLPSLDLSGWDTSNVIDMSQLFRYCSAVTFLDLSGWNTSNVTNFRQMFESCSELTSLNLSSFDTSSVTAMTNMFYGCSSLLSLDLSNWDTSNVTIMQSMFSGCSSLESLDLSGWDTSNVTGMTQMFRACKSLASLDLSSFDTSAVMFMNDMFNGCSSLASLDLSGFDVSSVRDMYYMFQGCSSLTSLDLSGFDTSNVVSMLGMFSDCSALSRITLGKGFVFKDKDRCGFDRAQEAWSWAKGSPTSLERYTSEQLVSSYDGAAMAGTYYWSEDPAQVLVVFNPTDGSLAFYNRPGAVVPVPDGASVYDVPTDGSGVPWSEVADRVLSVSFVDGVAPTSTTSWFEGMSACTSVGLSGLDTSNVVDMSRMFSGCSSLESLDLSGWDTSGATNMSGMFQGCSSLESLGLSSFDTSNVEGMQSMFSGCSSLASLDLSSFGTSNVADMQSMFSGCSSLSEFSLGEGFAFREGCGFDRVQDGWSWAKGSPDSKERYTSEQLASSYDGATMAGAYYWSEDSLPYAVFDPSAGSLAFYNRARSDVPTPDGATVYNVPTDGPGVPWSEAADRVLSASFADTLSPTSTAGWFSGMSSCTSMDLANLDTSNVSDMSGMFRGCSSLTSLDLSGWDTSGATNMSGMFQGCSSLASLDVSDFDTSSVEYMFEMFEDCSSLASLDLSGWDTSSVVLMSGMFDTCSSLTSLDISDFNTSSVLDMSRMFRSCSALVSLDLSSFDTSSVEYYMSFMFYDCSALVSLELPSFDTSKVTSMSNMFHGCSSLTSLDLSGWDNSSVIDMSYMFQGCSSLTSLDLSDFGTSNVKGMQSMFSGCSSLTSLDLSDFDTSNVEGMQSMFSGCVSLESLDLSAFDTSKVVYLSWMLLGCESLTALDLSGWDTSSVADMGEMLKNCSTLSMITFGEEFMFNENSGFDRAEEGWSWAKGSPTSRERYTSEDLVSHNYGLGIAGTYYWSEDPKSYAVFDPTEGSLTFYDRARSDMPVPAGATVFDVLLDGSYASWSEVADRVLKVSFADELAPTSTQFWFSGMTSCTSMDLTKLDTSNVTDMSWMFEGCTRLTSLDLSSFNTACTENMSGMFDGCSSLASLDLAPFKTSNVKNMTGMFLDCSSLTALDLSGFDTLSVTAMDGMFYGCSSLESLDLSSFDTSSTASMQFMFYDCASLSALALGADFAFGESCGLDRAQEGWSWAKGSPDSRERYTSEQLVSRYDGAKMAGTYYFAGDISRVEVSGVVDKVYTGKALYQSNLRVFLGGQELAKDVGYSVAYSDNVNAGTATVTITGKGDYAGTKRITFEVLPAALGTMTFGQSSYVYDGKQKNPAVTVKAEDGTVLKAGADYDLAVPAGRTDAGSYTYTATGKGNYAGTKEIAFTISPAKLASMTLSPSSYTYDGSPKNPVVTVRGENGATLKYEKDYDLTIPSGRVAVGSYTFIAKGKGNYTGSAIAVLKVTAAPAPPGKGVARPHRLYGDTALDTMSAIVDAGAFPKGGTVVLATSDGYWDALTAAGIAGLANAPVLMTDGKSLSSQTRAQIAKLKPKTIVICGGPAAVSRAVESQAKSAAGGATAIRCQGDTATGTACKIFENGSRFGSWSGTAFVCTNAGYWDALAAAPISYAKHMPIFLTEGASDISTETINAMKKGGITKVYIVGGRYAITQAVLDKLNHNGIKVVDRLWGDDAIETSEKVAQFGIGPMKMKADNMGVATTDGYWDALAGAALCGRKGSVLVLANGPQASSVTGFMKRQADNIADFYIFGGSFAVSKATEDAASMAAK